MAASAEQVFSNNTDSVDQQEFVDSMAESFFTWVFASLLPKVVLALYALLLAVGVGANALLVGVAFSSGLYKHPVHSFLLQLSLMDILACLSVVMPTLVTVAQGETSGARTLWEDKDGGRGGRGLCKLHAFLFTWFFILTFVLYKTMLVERASHAVVKTDSKAHLQTFGNPCFVRLLSVGAWSISFLVALLLMLTNSDDVRYRRDQYQCALDFAEHAGAMHALFSLTVYSSPMFVVISMCVVFWTRRRKIQSYKQSNQLSRTDASATKADEMDSPYALNAYICRKPNSVETDETDAVSSVHAKQIFNLDSKKAAPDLDSTSSRRYKFSQHTEKTEANTTTVFEVERVRPGILLQPIMKPLHRSNVRVGALPHQGKSQETQMLQNQNGAAEDSVANNVDGRKADPVKLKGSWEMASLNSEWKNNKAKPKRSETGLTEFFVADVNFDGRGTRSCEKARSTPKAENKNGKLNKLAMPEFRSKQLWVKARGVLAVRNTSPSVLRDVPHDVHHHQSMTYFISWAVVYLLWLVYVIAAFVEVYGAGQPCQVCYRAGVLLGLSSYSVRPLVLIAHNRWYREQCGQELKKAKICFQKRCNNNKK
ncbi:hypothetical protein EGW08_003035 [Elysia chlorotica]|uniref:G-protein coupled receptors family 1 profile domain-containing protein n=1 Tax=Elysia chlorotica TaxID=188477 RepID=A0A3S1BQT6_ELYCH|nr:hypothetical protein EGW08_003035 [Elysia chlorotica]